MSCASIRERLVAFIDDELDPEERAEIVSHLETCSDCANERTELDGSVAALQRAGQAILRDAPPPPPTLRRRSRSGHRLTIAAVLLVLALVLRQPEEVPPLPPGALPDHPPGAELIDSYDAGGDALARLVATDSFNELLAILDRERPRLHEIVARLSDPPRDWTVTKKAGAVVVRPIRSGWSAIILIPDEASARITRLEARGPDGLEQFEPPLTTLTPEMVERLSELGYLGN